MYYLYIYLLILVIYYIYFVLFINYYIHLILNFLITIADFK